NEWAIELPTEPTPNIVLIKNISSKTKEATIKDFFSFCGIIKAFEMKKEEELQIAIVYFEQEAAAKTATLLSQAVVDENPIIVEPYFKTAATTTTVKEPITNTAETDKEITSDAQQKQENKSVSHVMTELLASGYVLTDSVLAKGAEFDEKHGVSTRMSGYLNKVGINLTRFSPGQKETSEKDAAVATRSNSAPVTSAATSRMHNLMKSRAGLKVQGIASRVAGKVTNVHEEAKRI
ncbi:hypothetical protein BDF21DRAFT_303808, partial [Thamnidium elegans]